MDEVLKFLSCVFIIIVFRWPFGHGLVRNGDHAIHNSLIIEDALQATIFPHISLDKEMCSRQHLC